MMCREPRQRMFFVQPDGRYVVRGPRGREHIFAAGWDPYHELSGVAKVLMTTSSHVASASL